ncbi:LysE family translocator [Candidatus Liberibacter africanus]|uniref:LysE family translocator n=1 Tax=Liberibacter africanus TaxID=34020 RepID=UPI00339D9DC7
MAFETWLSFVVFCFVIASAPGPGNILTINHSLQHGWRSSKTLILGQEIAVFIIMLAVTLGTKFLSSLDYTMLIIKVLGVCWLIYSAWGAWFSPFNDLPLDQIPPFTKLESFTKGFITDFTNGKAWILLMAMIPPYLNMEHRLLPQSLILSFTVVGVDTMVLVTYAFISGQLRKLFSTPKFVKIQNRVSAVVLLLLTFKIAYF